MADLLNLLFGSNPNSTIGSNNSSGTMATTVSPIVELCTLKAFMVPDLMFNETAREAYISSCVTNSNTNTSYSKSNNFSETRDMVNSVVYTILAIACIVGNILVFVVVLGNQNMRKSMTNIFIVNLAIADFFVGIFCFLQVCTENNIIKNSIVFVKIIPTLCKLQQVLQVTMLSASVGILLLISADRYTAIIYPFKQKSGRRRQWYFILSGTCWLFAVMFGLPNIYFYEFTSGTGICQLAGTTQDYFFVYYCITLALLFILPFVIMSLLYGRVCVKLLTSISQFVQKSHNQRSTTRDSPTSTTAVEMEMETATEMTISDNRKTKIGSSSNTAGQLKHKKSSGGNRESGRKKIVFMFVTIVVSFLLCKLPKTIYVLLLLTKSSLLQFHVTNFVDIIIVAIYLIYLLPSALNPIIYFSFSYQFRQGLSAICCRLCRK